MIQVRDRYLEPKHFRDNLFNLGPMVAFSNLSNLEPLSRNQRIAYSIPKFTDRAILPQQKCSLNMLIVQVSSIRHLFIFLIYINEPTFRNEIQ